MRQSALLVLGLLVAVMMPSYFVHAVGTSYWKQSSEAEFKNGTLENVVATNLGDLKLSRAIKTLLDENPQISSVNTLAEAPDGTIYAGTGPNALLLQIKNEKASIAATIPNSAGLLSMLIDKSGAIFLGTGGEKGYVMKIAKPGAKPETLLAAEGVQYVWALAQTPDGNIYAATGPAGQLFEIKPDGSHRVLLETAESNLLSLVSDGKDLLYFGTDPHGLVYRVNRKTGESFVLYNAAESEVSALVLDKNGNLYAGTSEAKEEPPALPEPAAAPEKGGRPEGGAVGIPIPTDRPKEPTPPPPPNPNPGQPDPIPKSPPAEPKAESHEQGLIRRRAVASATAMRGISIACPMPVQSICVAEQDDLSPIALRFFRERASLGVNDFLNTQLSHFAPDIDSGARVTFALFADDPGDNPPDAPGKKRRPRPGPGNPGPNPGKPQPAPSPQSQPAALPVHQPPVDTTAGAEPRPEGNAIYRIDPDGFVTEIFRQPVLILSMVENNGTLLVATGGTEGQVYQVKPSADETLVLAKVDAKQIMCLMSARDGKVYMGTADVGTLASMSGGFATKGTFTSEVLDATQISRFGKIHLHGALPAGTTITVATRSGNVKEADEKTWSKWSDENPAAEFLQVVSPSARFLQYRLTLSSTEGQASPVVNNVSIAYQVPNLPPQIKAIKIANSPGAGATDAADPDAAGALHKIESARKQLIAWEASDPNNDTLTYALFIRPLGEPGWILMKDNLTDPIFEWDTRMTADGRYELKVTASDAASNPPGMGKIASRVSDPVTVDNTPPVIGDLKSQQRGGDMQIDLKVVDRTSTVAAVDFSVDSSKEWQFVLPTDQIYDSPEETVSFTIPHLKPGPHQVTLRATDSKGNTSFENLFINVQSPAAEAK